MDFSAFPKRGETCTVGDMEGAHETAARLNGAARPRHGIRFALRVSAAAGVAIVLGFLAFCTLIIDEPGDVGRADGIVALTGGEARIPEAVKLLARGSGRRLLISGVNPATTRGELVSLMPNTKMLFRCCIDMDKVARDTIGNADETRVWMEKRRFRSLIVVTSSYHMPRSFAELRRAMPDIELIPFPVKPRSVKLGNAATPRLGVRQVRARAGALCLFTGCPQSRRDRRHAPVPQWRRSGLTPCCVRSHSAPSSTSTRPCS
jgi:uncharacterized SAM-binding protein YcdF (DUF218 family)